MIGILFHFFSSLAEGIFDALGFLADLAGRGLSAAARLALSPLRWGLGRVEDLTGLSGGWALAALLGAAAGALALLALTGWVLARRSRR